MHPKFNLGPQAEDLILRPTNRREKTHPRGQFIGVDWDKPEDSVDADSIFERREGSTRKEETATASDWLHTYLRERGEAECSEIFEAGQRASHSAAALKRAKLRAGGHIRHRRTAPGRVVWFVSSAAVG